MPIFEKLPQNLGLCPIVKFRSTSEKSDPPNILWTPSADKSCINYWLRQSKIGPPKHLAEPHRPKNPASITAMFFPWSSNYLDMSKMHLYERAIVRPHLVGCVVRVRHIIHQGSCCTRAAFLPLYKRVHYHHHVEDLLSSIYLRSLINYSDSHYNYYSVGFNIWRPHPDYSFCTKIIFGSISRCDSTGIFSNRQFCYSTSSWRQINRHRYKLGYWCCLSLSVWSNS